MEPFQEQFDRGAWLCEIRKFYGTEPYLFKYPTPGYEVVFTLHSNSNRDECPRKYGFHIELDKAIEEAIGCKPMTLKEWIDIKGGIGKYQGDGSGKKHKISW